jgi:hypothetical protein
MNMGFKLNLCDPCVENLEINRKQCKLVWYVDGNRVSHINPKAVSMVIRKIEEQFKNEQKKEKDS